MSKLYSIKEASELLNLKESYLRAAVFHRRISYLKVNRLVRFREEDLDQYLNDFDTFERRRL